MNQKFMFGMLSLSRPFIPRLKSWAFWSNARNYDDYEIKYILLEDLYKLNP